MDKKRGYHKRIYAVKKIFIGIIVFLMAVSLGIIWSEMIFSKVENRRMELKQEIELLKQKQKQLSETVGEMYDIVGEIYGNLNNLLENIEVKEVNLSFYAPLDPNAIEGICYSGDPEITASGERVIIGETIAAGPDIPFYTKIYLPNRGWYTVHDRGAKIGNNDLDIAVATRKEALKEGKSTSTAVFFYPRNLRNGDK